MLLGGLFLVGVDHAGAGRRSMLNLSPPNDLSSPGISSMIASNCQHTQIECICSMPWALKKLGLSMWEKGRLSNSTNKAGPRIPVLGEGKSWRPVRAALLCRGLGHFKWRMGCFARWLTNGARRVVMGAWAALILGRIWGDHTRGGHLRNY